MQNELFNIRTMVPYVVVTSPFLSVWCLVFLVKSEPTSGRCVVLCNQSYFSRLLFLFSFKITFCVIHQLKESVSQVWLCLSFFKATSSTSDRSSATTNFQRISLWRLVWIYLLTSSETGNMSSVAFQNVLLTQVYFNNAIFPWSCLSLGRN